MDPFFLPPVLANRWRDGRQATGLRKNERQGSRGRDGEGDKNRRTSEPTGFRNESPANLGRDLIETR